MQQDEYDIGAAFAAIEEELTASMMRNMKRHRAEETKEGIQWSMWQAEQLKALERYKRENKKRYAGKFQSLNREIEELIRKARETGGMEQERAILNAIRNDFKAEKISPGMAAEFFKLNERKLEALIEAVTHDMEKAETAVLRMSEDQYRKIIFNAQVYANTGAGTYEKAVDMASRDFLAAGINCIQYANGARHTLSDYADMAIRTASKRAYLQGEGEKRQEWGISTVIMNKRGNPCPKCLPFVGKVLIDDVWSGGRKDGVDPETGKRYPLMSKAIEAGLYHPRCKDSHTTYFPGISTADDTWTKKELEAIGQNYAREQKEQYAERQAEKYGRLAAHSLDEENQKRYAVRREEWKKGFSNSENDSLDERLAASLRTDEKFQNRAAQRREEWKKRHASFDKENAKLEINTIRSQMENLQKQISENSEKEKILEKKVYFDGTGSDEDMAKLKALVDSRKKSQEDLDALKEKLLAKQEIYKTEAENRIVKEGIVEEIKLFKKMTPETVDALEDTLKRMKDKYGIMPKGIVYNPIKVPDATASYNWLDDKIYISNRFKDIEKYAEIVKASEASLKEYQEKSKIIDIQKEKLKNAEKILSDKSIKGYEREKAVLAKAEAEIGLNIQRMAVRENLMDVLIHEYGHFIHRHAETDYVQKSKVFRAKELGGKLINGDWKYDINTRYSAKAKIDAAKISKYATENPYETFAEGFLAMDKGENIPNNIAEIINEAKIKAGVKSVARGTGSGIMELPQDELSSLYQYKSFEAYPINEALRNAKDKSDLSPAQQQFVKRLDSALSKIPKYEGNLIRTVNFSDWPDCDKRTDDFSKEFVPGKNIQIRQYWSTSKREGYDDEAGVKIYIQNAQNGRNISSVGLDEAEVLYERNSMFEVISKMNREGIWYILLKEV